jgi:uncharacterized protein
MSIIQLTEDFVKQELSQNDGSHDWFHIDRVRKLALRIAKEEKVENLLVIELASLLHDVKDWKYSGSDRAGEYAVQEFLTSVKCSEDIIKQVICITSNIGYRTELGNTIVVHSPDGKNRNLSLYDVIPELSCVQDADRLDAIGAIGIARCFTYGGSRKRSLYNPEIPPILDITKEEYTKLHGKDVPILNHFYEKLFKLKDMMKTKTGKKIAEERHKFMEDFVIHFLEEWNCENYFHF